ncbi:DUF2516 family protein [Corynebacterium poyangense]|uniref:DUF2516 family protein n=1 Tax=Corynebacterium poyangense TaxID=2684405 RepID=A0A7H0SS37_9CORY|nr:DUF2516 family protein [Corynebacterium poyangense]QNQ91362.1 DUF2516 family protein [Corynebacterium poyangense]
MGYGQRAFSVLLAIAGLVGAALAASTRDDAFPAADRMSKLAWVGMLLASSAVLFLNFTIHLPLLTWIAIVIIGIYWFDVRPQIKSLIDGTYGYS